MPSTLPNNERLRGMIYDLDLKGKNLTPWEVDFIGRFIDEDQSSFSEKQAKIICKIYDERMG